MGTYNLDNISEMTGGDEEFTKVIVQTFLEEIPPDLEAMNASIAEDNAAMAYQYAHKMKPNFEMFGLDLLPQVQVVEAWSRASASKAEVEDAAGIINKKVGAALPELKRDFDL